jgi:hypothetical protein
MIKHSSRGVNFPVSSMQRLLLVQGIIIISIGSCHCPYKERCLVRGAVVEEGG